LCHDVGHGFQSHVSENALADYRECEDLILSFQEKRALAARPKLSEIAAFFMIQSPGFTDLLTLTGNLVGEQLFAAQDTPRLLGRMILGEVVADDSPLLQELLSGPFDADKLDYLTRDALMCGVPSVPDVPRLIQKVRAVKVSQADLPEEFAARVKGGFASYMIIGVARSGARALDELAVGRSLMADKVYRHQKVRATEAMVAAIMSQLADLLVPSPITLAYRFTDEQFLDLSEAAIANLTGRHLTGHEQAKVAVALDLIQRLRARRLFVRTFAFAQAMPLDPYSKDPEQRVGMSNLMADASATRTRKELVRQIVDELKAVLDKLGEQSVLNALPTKDLAAYIWLDPTASTRDASPDASRALLINEDESIVRFRDDYGETQGWADAYLLTRDLGYIFSIAELSPYIFLAAERHIRKQYGIRIPRSMLPYSNQNSAEIDGLRQRLADRGYYRDAPPDLRPIPDRLLRADIPRRLDRVVASLRGYSRPVDQPDGPEVTLGPARIIDWVRQFDNEFAEQALAVVENTHLIGRRDTVSAVQRFLVSNPSFRGASLCVLGGPHDSSGVNVYWAHDVAANYELKGRSLVDGISTDSPILFVDDFIGTGWQASAIVASWFGENPPVELNEDRPGPLPPNLREDLSKKSVGFLFVAGQQRGVDKLREITDRLIPKAIVRVDIDAINLPRAFGRNMFGTDEKETAFRQKCEEIGKELLSSVAGHDAAWVDQRALGYGNDAFLVVSSNNTPTATLTCLWAQGQVAGSSWLPLFPRRPKN
jgi:HD superfamily phosphohydrolase